MTSLVLCLGQSEVTKNCTTEVGQIKELPSVKGKNISE